MYIKYLIIIFALLAHFEFIAQIKYTSKRTGMGTVTDITHAGDGSQRIFVANKSGTITILDASHNTLGTLLNISTLIATDSEKGLLGLAFHPDFDNNGYFFVNYNPTGTNHTVIARFTAADPLANTTVNNSTQKTILTIATALGSNHKAGDLAFGPDGYLYIATGDGGGSGDPQGSGQSGNTFLGKILRLDINTTSPYVVPSTNPFISNSDGILNEIWDLGLRNPWRISFDKQTNDLWIADVGQGAREEVNFEASGSGGKNYGWNCREGKIAYNGCSTPASNFIDPIFDYTRCGSPCIAGTGNSITGGFVYRGTVAGNSAMAGYYIFSDYISKHAWMIKYTSGSLTDTKTITSLTSSGITSFGELENGEIMAGLSNGDLGLIESTECTQAPTIVLSSPASSYPRGSSFTVNTTVSDPDGTPVRVEFYNNNTLLETDYSAPFNLTISPANAASYSITGKVFDNCGLMNTSSALVITTTVSCSDGIQNGTETGVDCGGNCSACSSGCATATLLSQGKTTTQSSNYSTSYPSSSCVDGNLTNFNHTAGELQPWWQVDLEVEKQVSSIQLTNRPDCCGNRLKRFRVFVSNTLINSYANAGFVYEYNNAAGLGNGQVINIPNINKSGRYVRVWVDYTGYGNNYLHFAEVKVFGCCSSNQDPSVSVTSDFSNYPMGSSFTINAFASDPGGIISFVEFYNGSSLLGSDNSAPYSFTVSSATSPSYSITAKATDDCGNQGTSNTLVLTTSVSCSDGYKNGSETGVDCGGNCTACPQGCPTPVNLSQGKSATQSGNFDASNSYPASFAVDGSIIASSFNHTSAQLQPWWQVDLGNSFLISGIEITQRTGCSPCTGRTKRFRVFVSSSPVASFATSGSVFEYNNPTGLGNGEVITIPNLNATGQYVRVWVDNGSTANYLHLAEVKVMGCCATNQNPSISITSLNSSYPQGGSLTINATANDPGGTITNVEFYNGNSLIGSDNTFPYSHTISPAILSSYTLTAKATDNCNGTTTSNTLVIPATAECDDGFQNGSETGIDCGGNCITCPQGCTTVTNISQGKSTSQSSNFNQANSYPASMAVDGSTATGSFNHTGTELQPWFQIDLAGPHFISNIEITNRTGCTACAGRLKRFKVFVSSSPINGYSSSGHVYEFNNPTGLSNGQVINIPNINVSGRYIKIWMDNSGYGNNYLHLAEVRVLGCAYSAALSGPQTEEISTLIPGGQEVNLFPNPAREMIQLQFYPAVTSAVRVQVYDLQGKLLQTETMSDQKININKLASGTYIFRIYFDQKIYMHKVVKT